MVAGERIHRLRWCIVQFLWHRRGDFWQHRDYRVTGRQFRHRIRICFRALKWQLGATGKIDGWRLTGLRYVWPHRHHIRQHGNCRGNWTRFAGNGFRRRLCVRAQRAPPGPSSKGWSLAIPPAKKYFGQSLALSGDTALVGAAYESENEITSSGSAYIFSRSGDTWDQKAKLCINAPGDNFGDSVSISGNTAVVGNPYKALNHSGSVYVYRQSGGTWSLEAALTASDSKANDEFGQSVSLCGDTLLVGAYGDNGYSGAAYSFTRNGSTWTQQQKITIADFTQTDWFGFTVALMDGVAVIGAVGHDDHGIDAGAAYVFTFNGSKWTRRAKLTAFDALMGGLLQRLRCLQRGMDHFRRPRQGRPRNLLRRGLYLRLGRLLPPNSRKSILGALQVEGMQTHLGLNPNLSSTRNSCLFCIRNTPPPQRRYRLIFLCVFVPPW